MSGSDSDSDLQDSHPTSFEAEDAPSVSVAEDILEYDDDDDDDDDDGDDDDAQVMAAVVVDDEEPEAVAAAVGTPVKRSKKKRKSNEILGDNFEAAQTARLMLLQSVHRLPLSISESHTVRSFGRLRVEKQEDGPQFSSTSALYPVGFSCDRFEFSPVHGRILKLRCTILDGHQLQAKQRELNIPVYHSKGPIFRIMWGEGIDDDSESFEYPYDPGTNSTCITSNGNSKKDDTNLYPEKGMRARVRYEHDQWYIGTILECVAAGANYETGVMTFEMRIAYDDGSEEQVSYPDPDISLHVPGTCFGIS